MESLLNSLKLFFIKYGIDKTYWIGYSGGLDSHVLLSLCAAIRAELPIQCRAVHVNHGLSPRALEWQQHCARVCAALSMDFTPLTIDVKHGVGDSPEEIARHGRYTALAGLLVSDDVLLTAHQQDDQAETLLLQLFRGAGPKGLAAMPVMKSFAQGFHARPLLSFTRDDLKQYAEQQSLHWLDDESNLNLKFTRNFLRHDVMPLLKKRWPTVTKTISRVAEHCAESEEIIESVTREDLNQMRWLNVSNQSRKGKENLCRKSDENLCRKGEENLCHKDDENLCHKGEESLGCKSNETLCCKGDENLYRKSAEGLCHKNHESSSLSIKHLLQLSAPRQRAVLRAWLRELQFPIPSAVKLQQIQHDFLTAAEDKSPYIQWKNVELRRYRDRLYAMSCLVKHDAKQIFIWDMQQPLILPNIGVLRVVLPDISLLHMVLLNISMLHVILLNISILHAQSEVSDKQVIVRFRQGGEVLQLPGRSEHHELKKLFQYWNVPPWERDRIPLIYFQDKLVAVTGYFLDVGFKNLIFISN